MANALGVDVSHWQSTSDWSPTGLTFIIAKASEGTTKDVRYDEHIAKARAAGLLVGAYAFNRADVSMTAQVDAFIAAAGNVDFYAIDVEEENVTGTQKFTFAQTQDFIKAFRSKTGKKIGLYMSESGYYFGAGQDFEWIAHWYVSEPTYKAWELHQYRGSPLDLDQFNGTPAEMKAWVSALNNGGTRVNTFTVPEDDMQANVIGGSWLYDNSDLAASTGNIKLDPGRYLAYVGQFSATPDIRIVAYEPTTPDTNTTSKAMFVPRASISSFRKTPDLTPYDQADIDAATAPLKATIDTQATTIATLKTDLAESEAEVLDLKGQVVHLTGVIGGLDEEIKALEAVVADYDDLRDALRKAVAP